MIEFKKGADVWISDNFHSDQFDCPCKYPECITTIVDPDLVIALEALYEIIGEFKINSGFRCARHNKEIGGEKKSFHLSGMAVDIESTKGIIGPEMAKYALQVELFERGGLGVASHWIHVDVRPTRARWTYPILNS